MISLEPVEPRTGTIQRNFDKLKRAVIDTAGRTVGIRWGTAAFTWPGSTSVHTSSVDHGLGRPPVIVLATNADDNTAGLTRTYGYTDTSFTLDVIAPANVTTGTGDTYRWLAIG